MTTDLNRRQLRVGMQVKSIVILTFLMVGVTISGGWFYFMGARQCLLNSDREYAVRIGEGLGLAAAQDLRDGRRMSLERLVDDCIRNQSVRFVGVLDGDGTVVASAYGSGIRKNWSNLIRVPVSVSSVVQSTEDILTFSRPVVISGQNEELPSVVGAIRLGFDTSSTQVRLAEIQQRMSIIGAAVVLCAIPLGCLLVWRVMVQPIKQLVEAARRLGSGDYSVRIGKRRNDEIGELGAAFDEMAEEIARKNRELVLGNERLEGKVTRRTQELRDTNARLREAMTEKEDFLRGVSHDLNAPLRNMAGMATMILIKYRDELSEEVIAKLQRIQTNADVGSSLIAELLQLSRIKSRPERREVVDMNALLERVAGSFDFELLQHGVELQLRGPFPTIYVEKNRIRQVFQNLIDNAIKYMNRPSGGRIGIGYEFTGESHQFYVEDNGPGISEEDQRSIFYVFRRGSNAVGIEGKGVGLALVKNVVSNYEGRVWVRSQPGSRSTFYVSLDARCTESGAGFSETEAACGVVSV